MTRFRVPAPEQVDGDWLIADDDHETITAGFQIEGDTWHLGWSTKVVAEDGMILPLPVVERLLREVQDAIQQAMDSFEWEVA